MLSCCTWALSGEDSAILSQLAGAGFTSIDVRAIDFTSERSARYIKDLGLGVSCMGLSFGLPDAAALDSADTDAASRAIDHTLHAIEHAARLGVSTTYVVPGMDDDARTRSRFAEALTIIADRAYALGIRVCIEHFPGRTLPTVTATLDFIRDMAHPNVYLLFDIGHAQISGEDFAGAIHAAGTRLGYVHLDDNDGNRDMHLSLLDGMLTEIALRRMFAALEDVGYGGPVSLELHPSLPDPLEALIRSRGIVLRMRPETLKA